MPRLPFRAAFKPIFSAENLSLSHFRTHHFTPGVPFLFPPSTFTSSLPCIQKWFETSRSPRPIRATALQLNTTYLLPRAENASVTVEVTTPAKDVREEVSFERTSLPFAAFLQHLQKAQNEEEGAMRLYIAQSSLSDLPVVLQDDVPTPEIVLKAGRGDIYGSSLWMGIPPTHTPLHKDPNPNLFVQIAGSKVVRMMAPDLGARVLGAARAEDGGWDGRSAMRGEGMIVGTEGRLTESVVWGEDGVTVVDRVVDIEGLEANLGPGYGLFIPKGWWHSVKGTGEGVNASVNWWFR